MHEGNVCGLEKSQRHGRPVSGTRELAAGWFVIDVGSEAQAHEVAAYLSSAPGKGGQPLYEWIEARPVMSSVPATEQ